MLERLITALPEGNRKFPLRYRRMISSMSDRIEFARSRYLFGKPVMTPGTEMLKQLFLNFDVDTLDSKYSTDMERYTAVIKFYKDSKLQLFDTAANGMIKGSKFIRQPGTPIPEIILNVECNDPANKLPMDKDWSDWQMLRAVRLIYHNSQEIVENFSTSMFTFTNDPPTFDIISLDVAILLFKYYKYWKNCKQINVPCDVYEFLQKHELSYFLRDQFDIWLMNLLTTIFLNPKLTVDDIVNRMTVPKRIAMENMLRMGVEGIKEFISLVDTGAIRPQDFIEIHWLSEGSIKDRVRDLFEWCQFPPGRQYLWEQVLLWQPYLALFMTLINFFPAGAINQVLKERGYETYVKYFKYSQMPSVTNSETVHTFIEAWNLEIASILTK